MIIIRININPININPSCPAETMTIYVCINIFIKVDQLIIVPKTYITTQI